MRKILVVSLFTVFALISNAQIPNFSFENWTQVGTYWTPDNWGCLNSITAPLGVYTCERGTPGNPGNYYIKITSKTVAASVVMPGIAVCGTLDPSTYLPTGGFPFTQRPVKLTGKYQHMIFGSSQGYIDVELSKWNTATNSRDIIAYGHKQLVGMDMSWTNFFINLGYQSTDTPDSCIIVLAASGPSPSNQDYLWVDNLAFSGTVGIDALEPITAHLNIYPNPADEQISVEYSSNEAGQGQITLTDFNGKQVYAEDRTFEIGRNNIKLSVTSLHLAAGGYVLGILNNGKLLQQRLVVK